MKVSRLKPGDRITRADGSIRAVLTVTGVDARYVWCECAAYAGLDGRGDTGRVCVPRWDAEHRYARAAPDGAAI